MACEEPRSPREPDPSTPESIVLEQERGAIVGRAVNRLSGRQRALLESMLRTPAPTYDELSAQLDMPIGSIGPTRDRALGRLRTDPEVRHLALS